MTMLVKDLFNEAPLTGVQMVSVETERLLREPINIAQDWQRAERLLQEVRSHLPQACEVKIALFKMYAYAYRCEESLKLIHEVLKQTAETEGFNTDWSELTLADIQYDNPVQGATRIFLYTLKALGFVSMRNSDLNTAKKALEKLKELDPDDQVGGSVVRRILSGLLGEDDDD